MRVLSWHGRGVAFSDSICPSCADRVRNEGLWGSPPPPVWPGSPQTALIFVGLPLVTALVLLATPLHDAAPPPLREDVAAAVTADAPATEPRLADRGIVPAAMPGGVVGRQARHDADVPAVIYETRRTRHRGPAKARAGSGSAPAVVRGSDTWLRPVAIPASIRLASATANTEAPTSAASPVPQSP